MSAPGTSRGHFKMLKEEGSANDVGEVVKRQNYYFTRLEAI